MSRSFSKDDRLQTAPEQDQFHHISLTPSISARITATPTHTFPRSRVPPRSQTATRAPFIPRLSFPWQQIAQIGKDKFRPRSTGLVGGDKKGGHCLESERYNYAFQFDECVVLAQSQGHLTCPKHGRIQIKYIAPDAVSMKRT